MGLPAPDFAAASAHARGASAEAHAARWLAARGYELMARNFDTPAGEIDLIALDGEVLCFVEVKARRDDSCGSPLEAVDRRRQRRLGRAAALYLAESGWRGPCRFDVVGMQLRHGRWCYELVEDAFWLEDGALA